MKVTLTHEEVTQACREWVERHYGFKAAGTPEMVATLRGNNPATYTLATLAITFPQCPKPEGGPYRTPG